MLEFLSEMWSYAFIRRAFVVTTVLSASMTPVGAFLVLRRLSLAGEAMAHAITPGIVIGFVAAGLSVTSLLFGGLIAGVGVAMLTALLAHKTILRSDAIPVIAPIGVSPDGETYNINADTVAGAIASELNACRLIDVHAQRLAVLALPELSANELVAEPFHHWPDDVDNVWRCPAHASTKRSPKT